MQTRSVASFCRISQANSAGFCRLCCAMMEMTSGVRSLGLLPPVALGPMNPVRWNLPKILLTQPLETCTEHTGNPTCWHSHKHTVKWDQYLQYSGNLTWSHPFVRELNHQSPFIDGQRTAVQKHTAQLIHTPFPWHMSIHKLHYCEVCAFMMNQLNNFTLRNKVHI